MKIVLADAHNLVRAGLRVLIENGGKDQIVGEARDGQELLSLVARLRPRLAIVELDLPVVNGPDALGQIRRHYPEVSVMMLAGRADGSQVRSAMRHGAAGFMVKQAEPAELDLALRAIERGQSYLSPAVSGSVVQRRGSRVEDSAALTPRQRQVLSMIGNGKSTKEIAGLLGVSVKTVETHRARLMQSLGLYGTNALMRLALRWGLDAREL